MSTESKHTPGPHYAINYAGRYVMQNSNYYDGDQREDGGSFDLLDSEDMGDEVAHANAVLYVAAPAMLAALETIASENYDDDDKMWHLASRIDEMKRTAKDALKQAKP